MRALAGCYRLTVGSWQRAPAGGPTMTSQQPPARFRLDTVVLPPPFDHRFAVQPAKVAGGNWPAGRSVAGDSVDLWWSTGFTGVRLRLAARGDTLVGRAETHHDSHVVGEPPDPEAPVRAVRTRCAGGRPRA
ncbi:hypothetical protein tb265_16540 [Gemmatimonadetes bacterium T265]|nr:hypothetical protein tb265_16540 [Gemmatimonadetes bacterium T265]